MLGLKRTEEDPQVKLSNIHFPKDLVNIFISIDIQLHKLRYQKLQDLFTKYNLLKVSQSSALSHIKQISENIRSKIIEKILNNKFL